jgi:AcrR family transcriptional regulator
MPRAVDYDERRRELAEAASRLIARAGIVAAEAGLTTGSLTHYFTDKRDLLQCTLSVSLRRRVSRRGVEPGADPGRALRATLAGALPIDEDSRRHWMVTVAFCAEAAGDEELAATQRDAYREFRGYVADLVGRCGSHDAVPVAERLIATVDGVAMQALFDPETWPRSRQLAALDAALADQGLLAATGGN